MWDETEKKQQQNSRDNTRKADGDWGEQKEWMNGGSRDGGRDYRDRDRDRRYRSRSPRERGGRERDFGRGGRGRAGDRDGGRDGGRGYRERERGGRDERERERGGGRGERDGRGKSMTRAVAFGVWKSKKKEANQRIITDDGKSNRDRERTYPRRERSRSRDRDSRRSRSPRKESQRDSYKREDGGRDSRNRPSNTQPDGRDQVDHTETRTSAFPDSSDEKSRNLDSKLDEDMDIDPAPSKSQRKKNLKIREPEADEDDEDEVVVEDGGMDIASMMGFGGFGSTHNQKIAGNDVGGVRKEKKTEYRQYMNRVGGFNRPLSPPR